MLLGVKAEVEITCRSKQTQYKLCYKGILDLFCGIFFDEKLVQELTIKSKNSLCICSLKTVDSLDILVCPRN